MELVQVRVRDCACPDKPHPDGDIVYLAPTLSLAGGLEAQRENGRAIAEAVTEVVGVPTPEQMKALQDTTTELSAQVAEKANERLVERWLPVFVRHGAVGWNFANEAGPMPFDVDVILADFSIAEPVANRAAVLYSESLMRPLVERLATQSPPTSTGATPKATRPARTSRPKPRRSSSRRASDGQPSATGQ